MVYFAIFQNKRRGFERISTIGLAIFSGKNIPTITAKVNIVASTILTLVISLTTYGDCITQGG
jgi:hypothetical protein